VLDVQLDGMDESLIFTAIEKYHFHQLASGAYGSAQPVHPIDNAHRLSVHHDRRQVRAAFSQPRNVGVINSA
jgi:hypothetical protein